MKRKVLHTRSSWCQRRAEAFARPWLCLTWESAHGTLVAEGSIPGEPRLVLVPAADRGNHAETRNVTNTSWDLPPEDMIVTCAVYMPACKSPAFATKVSIDESPEVSMPLVELICNQGASGVTLKVHVKVPPPVLVIMIDCGRLILPTIACRNKWVPLICMEGDATGTAVAVAVTTGVSDNAETRNVTNTSPGIPPEGVSVTCVV